MKANEILMESDGKIKKEDIQKAKQNAEIKTEIPVGYMPIRLSTQGKLSAPEVLHFRNFNIEEIIELASIQDEDEKLFSLIKCLNNMVAEDFDCTNLHEIELTELLYFIHILFNGLEIGPYSYYIDNDIPDPKIKNRKENIGEISFKPKDLNIINIDKNFKEPIKIKKGDKFYKFRLLRIKDTLMAKEYIMERFKEEKEKFVELEYTLQYNQNPHIEKKLPVDSAMEKEYKEYNKKKVSEFTKVLIASILVGNEEGDFDFDTALDKLQNNEIDLDFWIKYNQIAKSIDFGLEETIKFKCPKSKETLARGFLFQAFDFLPSMESQSATDYDVSFGD